MNIRKERSDEMSRRSQTNSPPVSSPGLSAGKASAERASSSSQLHIRTDEIIPLREGKILQRYLAAAYGEGRKQTDS